MSLKSHTTVPPAGWRYIEPKTQWKHASMGTMSMAVGEILEHRRFNNLPRASRGEVTEDLENYTCQRLGNDPAWCSNGEAQKKTSQIPAGSLGANPALESSSPSLAKAIVNGALILKDWLGEGGKPVADELAQSRANVCVNDCSDATRYIHFHNKTASFFGRVTGEVAKAILEQRREKTNLGLTVDGEDKLFTCDVCRCHLPLKVWVPMEIIMKRTEPELLKTFPAHCWMHTENRRTNQSLSTTATPIHEEK